MKTFDPTPLADLTDADVRRQVDALLGRDVGSVKAWEAAAFDAAAGGAGKPIVLFGAGGLGKKTLAGLESIGVKPAAFADNNPAAWGTRIDGIAVLSPAEAAARFGESGVFVVTIWRAGGKHRLAQFREQLLGLGCRAVVSFGLLYWKYPAVFLPYYALDLPHRVMEDREAVRAGLDLWSDDYSRREYLAQLRWRAELDFDVLPSPVGGEQYFPEGLFSRRADEVFIDVGAFDGDTLKFLVDRDRARFSRVVALEPDPMNFAKMKAYHAGLTPEIASRVTLMELAAGSRNETIRFEATGTASSTGGASTGVGAAVGVEVRCAPLDEVLEGVDVTFLKMDIEGAEPDALAGAAKLIARCRPVLAICVYHRQDHLWTIPLWIKRLVPEYRLYLRPHHEECWDLVCYAVPPERMI